MVIIDGVLYANMDQLTTLVDKNPKQVREVITRDASLPEIKIKVNNKRNTKCFSVAFLVAAVRKYRPDITKNNINSWIDIKTIEKSFGEAVIKGLGL